MAIPPTITITTDWRAVAPVYAGEALVFLGLLVEIWHVRAMMADNVSRQAEAAELDTQRRRRADEADDARRVLLGPGGLEGLRGAGASKDHEDLKVPR